MLHGREEVSIVPEQEHTRLSMLRYVGLSADPSIACSSMRGFLLTQGNYRHPKTLIRKSIVTALTFKVPRGRKLAVLVAKNAAGIMTHNKNDERHLQSGARRS